MQTDRSETILPRAGSSSAACLLPWGTRIAGVASVAASLPPNRVANEEIAARIGVTPEWIVERTGIRERRLAGEGASLTALAADAGRKALAAAGVDGADIDLVLVASFTQDELLPNAAPLVAEELGAGGAAACDLGAACTGFVTGLALAAAQIESGRAHYALVIGADLLSRVTDRFDRTTAALFADGAGAAVVGAGGPGRIGGTILRSDASAAAGIVATQEERLIRMQGHDVYRAAVSRLSEITREVLAADGLGIDDVDLFVYHQANARITRAVGERLGLPSERVVDCVAEQGNTAAATLPLALCHAAANGTLRAGARVLLAATGAGFMYGAGLIEWAGEAAP
jgi:3-oxoacyl-[acyl-carrier-protein] synthase-3